MFPLPDSGELHNDPWHPRPRRVAGGGRFDSIRQAHAIGMELETAAVEAARPQPEPAVFAEVADYQAWYDAGQPAEPEPSALPEVWDAATGHRYPTWRAHPAMPSWARTVVVHNTAFPGPAIVHTSAGPGAVHDTPAPGPAIVHTSAGPVIVDPEDVERLRQATDAIARVFGMAVEQARDAVNAMANAVAPAWQALVDALTVDTEPEDAPDVPLNRSQRRAVAQGRPAASGRQSGPQPPQRPPRELGRQRGKGSWR